MVSLWHVMTAEQGSLVGLLLTALALTCQISLCQLYVTCAEEVNVLESRFPGCQNACVACSKADLVASKQCNVNCRVDKV